MLVEIDLGSGLQTRRVPSVGLKSHGLVQWRNYIVSLDSDNGALMLIDPRLFPTRNDSSIDSNHENKVTWRLWSVREPGFFLKGLAVVDDVAYFGIAPSQTRQARESVDLNCELAAFDLIEGVLLWRKQIMTKGLLNIIAAPQLQVESTATAVWVIDAGLSYRATTEYARALSQAKRRLTLSELEPLEETDPLIKYPPVLSPYSWASGWPRFDLTSKDNGSGISSGAQLLLFRRDVSRLKEFVLNLGEEDFGEEKQRKTNAWLSGRERNLHNVKPGVSSIHLIFSDQDGDDVYEFPWYYEGPIGKLIEPILDQILGEDVRNIIRVQLARMPPGSTIRKHVDVGGYSTNGHRIHVVVSTSPAITFQVCAEPEKCIPLHVEEGLVFELNNRLQHFVDNPSNSSTVRVHLVIDVVESPRKRKRLARGQECAYRGSKIFCDLNR